MNLAVKDGFREWVSSAFYVAVIWSRLAMSYLV